MTERFETIITQRIEDRTERMAAIESAIDDYIEEYGIRPEPAVLSRLADEILREELSDSNPHKVAHADTPFLSESQLNRREMRELSISDVQYDNVNVIGFRRAFVQWDDGVMQERRQKINAQTLVKR